MVRIYLPHILSLPSLDDLIEAVATAQAKPSSASKTRPLAITDQQASTVVQLLESTQHLSEASDLWKLAQKHFDLNNKVKPIETTPIASIVENVAPADVVALAHELLAVEAKHLGVS